MPSVNVYSQNPNNFVAIKSLIHELKVFCAAELSCKEFSLQPEEVSVRLIPVAGDGMIGSVEIEILAHNFEERVARQDEICVEVSKFVAVNTGIRDIKVWLALSELGHNMQSL